MVESELKQKARNLRKQGRTYSEICSLIKVKVPKSTLSYWLSDINIDDRYKTRIEKIIIEKNHLARQKALERKKQIRQEYLKKIAEKNQHLIPKIKDPDISKMMLAMLYWAEGAKTPKGSLGFGNSDPIMIRFFLSLLKQCYDIDPSKFRCTLQCRADQNIEKLQKFWSEITEIPLKQFYRARIDARTIGKPSKKPNYKGVCRIDYFSAHIYNELKVVLELINNSGPIV